MHTSVDISICTAGGHDYPPLKIRAPLKQARWQTYFGGTQGVRSPLTITRTTPLSKTSGPGASRHRPPSIRPPVATETATSGLVA